ncbi:unnamed protein product [Orchesella dallaii]|uniref:HAUS augmin-like complex subunit 6 N-terminal domain-containing protein n=1 Tax=Orchesella dallaii TaxID=48710 RepID=A0ABP1QK23_9HEXA
MDGAAYHTNSLGQNGNNTISNFSSLSDKNISHLFPYASTPSGSPLLNSTEVDVNQSAIQMQVQKANMKLPVGLLADSDQFGKKGRSKTKDFFAKVSRQNVTLRNRLVLKNDGNESSISPIQATSNRKAFQFTEPRGARQLFSLQKDIKNPIRPMAAVYGNGTEKDPACFQSDSGNSTSSVSKSVFPYPIVTVMDYEDSGEILCNSLHILMTLRELEFEKQRLSPISKRKDKSSDDKVEDFEFTKDTFNFVNSEAAIQALYLLFSSLNMKEAEQRFRDSWPVYEKKMEGIFRRVCLDWMKEIIELEPKFFVGFRTEAIGGLLVNPGGERFIAMMRQFCQFVMYTTAIANKDLIKQQVLLPPEPTQDPEITNRQLQVLTCRTQTIQEKTVRNYKFLLKTELIVNERIKRLDNAMESVAQEDEMYSEELKSCIYSYPDIFGTPSDAEMNEREEILETMKIQDLIENESHDDFIMDRLETLLKNQAEEIYKPITLLHHILEDYDKIWFILEMEKPESSVLDLTKIVPYQMRNDSGTPSFDTFMGSVMTTVDRIFTDKSLNEPVSSEVLNDFKTSKLRLNYLEVLEKEIKEEILDIPNFTPIVNFRDILKMRLESYDFSLLSKVHDDNMRSLLDDMTPLRVFDINKQSGRTPAINKFLDSSSCSSGERTTIVKRRSAHKSFQRPPALPQGNQSISKDMTDSSLTPAENPELLPIKNYKSDPLVLTPVSSQSNNIRNSRPNTTLLRKSVSFDSPPSSDIPAEQEPDISAGVRSSNSSVNTSSTATTVCVSQSNVSALSENLDASNNSVADTSNISDIELLIELDVPTQERVSKLLESIAHNRSSLSSFVELSTNDASNENTINRIKRDSAGVSLNELNNTENDTTPCFGNISVIEDWEDTKGIMDMSHIEMNSDSDD